MAHAALARDIYSSQAPATFLPGDMWTCPKRVGERRHAARATDSGFLSVEDSGETEDVGGLREEAADDGRAERTVRGPDARPREPRGGQLQIGYWREGEMFAVILMGLLIITVCF